MTHEDNNKFEADGALPDALRWELRALRRDVAPERDLWPSIAQRLAATPQVAPAPVVTRRTWRGIAPLATAASLALALGVAWQLRPIEAPVTTPAANDPHAQLITREAFAMTLEYQAALRELNADRPAARPAAIASEIKLLDQSAAQIRTALTRDPSARFLLDRLQHTYTRRLELTQRLATTPDARIAS